MKRTLTTLFITLTAFAISANAVAPLISTMSLETGIEASRFGYFIFIQFLSFALFSFIGGILKEKSNITNYLLVLIGLGIITIAFFIGPSILSTSLLFIIWIIPLGLSGGAVETFSSIEISNLTDKESSKNLSLSQVFYSVGAFLAPQIVYFCFALDISWKIIFYIFGFFSLTVLLFFTLLNRNKVLKKEKIESQQFSQDIKKTEIVVSKSLFLLFFFLMLFYVTLESFSASWLAYIFENTYEISAKDASVALILFWIGMILGRFSIVFLPDRYTLWTALIISSTLIFITSLLLGLTGIQSIRFILIFLLGTSCGPMWPVIVMVSSIIFPSEKYTSGIIGIGAIGFALGPLVGSLIVRGHLENYYFFFTLLFSIIIFALCMFSYRRYKIHQLK